MNQLLDHLAARIRQSGPISLATYMQQALGHPRWGFYQHGSPFGAQGSFVTAPEISQIFGELLGLWTALMWRAMGQPAPAFLIELGPGRGTLMQDALRALKLDTQATAALEPHLVETSALLRREQQTRLHGVWHRSLDDIPPAPALILANEFFDALPIHQLWRTETGWMERTLTLEVTDDRLRPGLAEPAPDLLDLIPDTLRGSAPGQTVELCPAADRIIDAVARRFKRHPGTLLIIDYGYTTDAPGDSLQAVMAHQYHDPFSDPGEADITAHVNFAALARRARAAGLAAYGPIPQGRFLRALGIKERADNLLKTATPKQAHQIEAALLRLVAPEQMGELFKVMVLCSPDLGTPEGF